MFFSEIWRLLRNINRFVFWFSDPYEEYDETGEVLFKPTLVDIDLDLSAHANAKRFVNLYFNLVNFIGAELIM